MKNEKQYILACAKFMDYEVDTDCSDVYVFFPDEDHSKEYSPTSGQQLNDVVEKARIDIVWGLKLNPEQWAACPFQSNRKIKGLDKDRNTAIIKCICSLLGVDYE